MPNTKLSSIRERVIDRCLSSGKSMTLKDIWEEVNKALIARGEKIVKSKNTILQDIYSMVNCSVAKLDTYQFGKYTYYRYQDPNFSIYLTPKRLEIIRRLNQIIENLNDFIGRPGFEWLKDVREKLRVTAYEGLDTSPVVSFSFNPGYAESLIHFSPLYDFIKTRTAIELTYKKFSNDEERTYVVHPYHLKEFQNRWYLFATVDHHPDSLACFAFDRIIGYKKSNVKYRDNLKYDFKEYFNQMVGLTIFPDAVPEKVLLWVKEKEYPYLKTNPIHLSQKYVKDADGGKIISLYLYINYELEMRILSYGEGVKVLAPDHFAKHIKERIEKLQNLYNDSQIELGIEDNR